MTTLPGHATVSGPAPHSPLVSDAEGPNLPLHPDHRKDLRASGLTDDTIRAAGLYSARPCDLSRLAGRPVPDGSSALVFPYDRTFSRAKFFPPLHTNDGREIRYVQPAGSPVRAYFKTLDPSVLKDPSRILYLTEGEKKALALTQAGFPTVGLGGIWNFRSKTLPEDALIPDLEGVAWDDRIVYLVPDSDARTNDQVLHAVYRLGRLLAARGAIVSVLLVPDLEGRAKTGIDDYLVAKPQRPQDLVLRLQQKAVNLGHSLFKAYRDQEKARDRLVSAPPSVPPHLVGRRLHPALHFDSDHLVTVGLLVRRSDGALGHDLVTSARERVPSETFGSSLVTPPMLYQDLVDRWRPEDLERYLAGTDEPPRFADAITRVREVINEVLELGRDSEATVLATWVVATYFFPVFLAFPRLDLRGERGSGKSKALTLLAALGFNGLLRVSPTPAVLFRLSEALRPTLCLDEIESLAGDDHKELLSILNQGYKRGGRVDRCEGDKNEVRSFDVYNPVALAGIKGLNRVTEDRAITLVLTRGRDRSKLNAVVDPADPRFAAVRDLGYRLALRRAAEVLEVYRTLKTPDWLVARDRELWQPLLTIATLAEREAPGLGLVNDLLKYAGQQSDERGGLSDEAEAVIAVLEQQLEEAGTDTLTVRPGELTERVRLELQWERAPSPAEVGRWLKRLGCPAATRGAGGKRRRVTTEHLRELRARYQGALPEGVH